MSPLPSPEQRVLAAAAVGEIDWTAMQELAQAILADRAAQLALRIQEGGDEAVAAGLELAVLVLRGHCRSAAVGE